MPSHPSATGSPLVSSGARPTERPSGSGQQPAPFPFGWQAQPVSNSQTIVKSPQSIPNVTTPASETNNDAIRRLFPAANEPDNVSGVHVGHFTIQRRIGEGGMGSVFLALDDTLRRNIALKILAPTLALDPACVQRFMNEARAAARLDHDNIARVFFYGEESGLHFIAFEYVAGTNLRDVIRQKGKLSPAEAVNYTMQIAAALSHTSAAGVIHRDIKPSNILITPQGRSKLVDLGLARRENYDASVELTVAGTTLGTFDYISPEQAKDPRNVDIRSDIYSLGCTLYHMLTGEPPYPDGTVLQKLLDHQGGDTPDPSKKNRRVSPELSAIVRRMMNSDPKQRPSNPGELLRELLFVARTLGQGAVPIDGQVWLTATEQKTPSWQRNVVWIASVATLILLALALEWYPNGITKTSANRGRFNTQQSLGNQVERQNGQTANSESGVEKVNAGARDRANATDSTRDSNETAKVNPPEAVNGVKAGPPSTAETVRSGEPVSAIQPIPIEHGVFNDPGLPLLSQTNGPSLLKVDSPNRTKPNTSSTNPENDDPTGAASATTAPPTTSDQDAKVTTNSEPNRPESTTDGSRSTDTPRIGETPRNTETARNRIVSTLDGKAYDNLEAACAEARDGSIIELRYNGRLDSPERPIRLVNKRNIIIRGGIGFRPQVTFAPTTSPIDPAQSRMVTVSGGSLEIVNVDIELTIPDRASADRWAIFSLERPEKLQLHGVIATLINPNAQPAAIIEQVAAPGQSLGKMGMMKNGLPTEPPKVSIVESLVRGDANLFLLRDPVAVRFLVKDSLVALNGILFHSICHGDAMRTEADQVSLELDHSTCVIAEGLITTEGTDNQPDRTPPISVMANNNIFVCNPTRPLVTTKDAATLMEADRQIIWNGDRNYYDGQTTFWQLGGRQLGASTRQLDFIEWRNYWGSNEGTGSTNAAVVWKTSPLDRAWAKFSSEAVALNAMAPSNPAVNGASDLKDAGAPLNKLPTSNLTASQENADREDIDSESESEAKPDNAE